MIDQAAIKDAYSQVFKSPAGRIVLGDLLGFGHVLDQVHTPGDAVHSAFVDGSRRTVLRILAFSGLKDDIVALVADVSDKPQEAEYGSDEEG